MKTLFLYVIFILLGVHIFGQNELILKGRIIDAETKVPLPYANIIYQSKSLGTISNISGYYEFHLCESQPTDSISISFIGYHTHSTTISEVLLENIIQLHPSINELGEIIINPNVEFVKQYMKDVISIYNENKLKDSHIAISHYIEKAKKNGKFIMYMESIGYTIYAGTMLDASPLSNYSFLCENTKCHVQNPAWMHYGIFSRAYDKNKGVPPGCGLNLNLFRYIETKGLLSDLHYDEYHFGIDSIYNKNNSQVLCLTFENKKSKGSIHVEAESKQILSIDFNGYGFWSNAFDKRVTSKSRITLSYYNSIPFLSSIESSFNRFGLMYSNKLNILTQKFIKFDLTEEEYWSINSCDLAPYIEYNPELWRKNMIPVDEDYSKIEKDLMKKNERLENHFSSWSGRWFLDDKEGDNSAQKILENLKRVF